MSNKNEAIGTIYRAIGFISAKEPYGVGEVLVKQLKCTVDFMETIELHEEYKAAWLNIVNTIHFIDPNWLEKYQGESEWEKAVAFISQMNQALRRIQDHSTTTVEVFADFDAVNIEDLRGYFRKYYAKGIRSGYLTDLSCYLAEREASTRAIIQEVISQIKEELTAAESKHPSWPADVVHATAILNEEAGELTQAAIEYHHNNGSLEAVRREAAQVGAMAIRVLINLPYAERPAVPAVKVTGAPR
ncbi:hypothetical protein [Serratia liquefaciens]|uniref:hypothetical protein n=1 Tax=Serratia liquefaciens TaxID=614 RepID=UPI0022B99D37|nr:hypothetical protein [Serratia liquefaciens]